MKLLIVDDSLIMRNAIERNVFNETITEIYTAADGEQALHLFAEHQMPLVTMDLTIPKLDGLSCIAQIRDQQPDTAILVISALNSHKTAMEAINRGACGFLVKPFTESEVTEAINDLVAHAHANA
jgi:two-component system chemotaxis response regulator CheY